MMKRALNSGRLGPRSSPVRSESTAGRFSGLKTGEHIACNHDAGWCLWERATWRTSYFKDQREEVRQVKLQFEVQLEDAIYVFGENHEEAQRLIRSLRRVKKTWDGVK